MQEKPKSKLLARLEDLHPNIDFSNCDPKTTKDYITPTCKEHGVFKKSVLKMAYKPFQGCPKCGAARRNDGRTITKEIWEKGVKEHWGDQFNTEDSVITGVSRARTLVICKYHGEVNVNAGDLYRGKRGCPECAEEGRRKSRMLSSEDFIQRSKQIHGDIYDYSEVVYNGTQNKVTLICKVHGHFEITPNSHFAGGGCNLCGVEKQKKTVQEKKHREYVDKLKERYGDEFDFSLTKYVDRTTPIIIICKQHGPFEADAWSFLSGRHGCPHCSGKYICNDDFKKRAEKIHGVGRYTYDLVQTTKHKFGIKCNICGLHWSTTPNCILAGTGCPNCAKSGFHPQAPAVLYNIEFTLPTGVKLYKVGITNNTVTERLMNMKVKHDVTYKVLDEIHYDIGRDANDQEQELKKAYAEYQYTGKKFMKNGWTEIFTVNPFTYAL